MIVLHKSTNGWEGSRVLTRSEIDDQIRIFVRNIDVKLPDDVLIVAIPYQAVDVMRTLNVTIVAVDNSGVLKRVFL